MQVSSHSAYPNIYSNSSTENQGQLFNQKIRSFVDTLWRKISNNSNPDFFVFNKDRKTNYYRTGAHDIVNMSIRFVNECFQKVWNSDKEIEGLTAFKNKLPPIFYKCPEGWVADSHVKDLHDITDELMHVQKTERAYSIAKLAAVAASVTAVALFIIGAAVAAFELLAFSLALGAVGALIGSVVYLAEHYDTTSEKCQKTILPILNGLRKASTPDNWVHPDADSTFWQVDAKPHQHPFSYASGIDLQPVYTRSNPSGGSAFSHAYAPTIPLSGSNQVPIDFGVNLQPVYGRSNPSSRSAFPYPSVQSISLSG